MNSPLNSPSCAGKVTVGRENLGPLGNGTPDAYVHRASGKSAAFLALGTKENPTRMKIEKAKYIYFYFSGHVT